MDLMKEALKRKLDELKGEEGELDLASLLGGDQETEEADEAANKASSEKLPETSASNKAPAIDELGLEDTSMTDPSPGSEANSDHLKILAALADKAPKGRNSIGLGERAGMAAKAKMDSMQKGKK